MNQHRHMSSSPASSSAGSISYTSTEIYFHEPFETYKVRVKTLCGSIGLGDVVVESMDGGCYNRVSKLSLESGDQCVLRVPRDIHPGPISHVENVKNQVGIISFVTPLLPVPGILAYDITADNEIKSPYIIQKLAPGQPLLDVLRGDLTIEDRFQIASIIADVLIRMETVSFRTPGRLVTGPSIPDRCDDFSQLSADMVIAPFKTYDGEVLKSTSSTSVADFMGAILDMYYEKSLINEKFMVSRWARLREVNQEMKSQGLLTCQQTVLWHWDFYPRNVLVDRTPDNNWKVTAVLDWDGVLSVPRVLTREPPVWLWQRADQTDQGRSGNQLQVPRKLTAEEENIKRHFEDCLKGSIDIEEYRADAYDKGKWARRLFDYLHEPFHDSVDWRTYEEFIKDWEAYCLEHAITEKPEVSDNSGNDLKSATVGKGDAKANQFINNRRNIFAIVLDGFKALSRKYFVRICREKKV